MMSDVFYWAYTLRSAQPLNAQSSRTKHEGALIRLGNGGVGCIHPWPELGDLPISEQLRILQAGERTLLIDGALKCAEADGLARARSESIFSSPIPESHWLAQANDEPAGVKEAGFGKVKLKGGPDLTTLAEQVKQWSAAKFQIRIDMNESVGLDAFLGFWNNLDEPASTAIELVEDPVVWNETSWDILRKEGIQIAADLDGGKRLREGDIRVFKPACEKLSVPKGNRFFVTSYMDHAIGQMWAAWNASNVSESADILTCGLMTHLCFEPDDFFERIKTRGPVLLASEGTGLGFDDLLEKLPWKKLT